jgi:CspA family cold shock protein
MSYVDEIHTERRTDADRQSEVVQREKGYGFIQSDGAEQDVFVHINDIQRAGLSTLNVGERVSFDIATERGKTHAANLKAG